LSGLRALLQDMPYLLDWSLADDTPVANGETMQWLKDTGTLGAADGSAAVAPPPPPPEPVVVQPVWYPPPPPPMERAFDSENGTPPPPDTYDLAMEAARNGQVEEALNILSREVAQEGSGRGRFLRRIQLAQVCLATGNREIGLPILQEVSDEIQRRGLEQWETGDQLAQPLALLYRCLDDVPDLAAERRALYARICRLDASKALGLR
jgi:type VI secretion system protein ImpA